MQHLDMSWVGLTLELLYHFPRHGSGQSLVSAVLFLPQVLLKRVTSTYIFGFSETHSNRPGRAGPGEIHGEAEGGFAALRPVPS